MHKLLIGAAALYPLFTNGCQVSPGCLAAQSARVNEWAGYLNTLANEADSTIVSCHYVSNESTVETEYPVEVPLGGGLCTSATLQI